MRRSTLFALAIGGGAALFAYTPTAAQWLALARDEGVMIPEELQSPPAIGGAVITLIVYLAVMLFRRVNAWIDQPSTSVQAVVVAAAVQQGLAKAQAVDGARIIEARNRKRQIDADIKEIGEARAEHIRERESLVKDLAAADDMLATAKKEQTALCAKLDMIEASIEMLAIEADDKRRRVQAIDENDIALSQTKAELLAERGGLS